MSRVFQKHDGILGRMIRSPTKGSLRIPMREFKRRKKKSIIKAVNRKVKKSKSLRFEGRLVIRTISRPTSALQFIV